VAQAPYGGDGKMVISLKRGNKEGNEWKRVRHINVVASYRFCNQYGAPMFSEEITKK
jgi:hypothetical protein